MRKLKLLIYSGFCVLTAGAQDYSKMKFGDISEKDFANKVYSIDSNAGAVVITDIGSSKIVGNNKGWFSTEFRHYRRVHILNHSGYDMANFSILLYKDGSREEKLDKLKAVAYNLQDGKVVEKKLETKSDLFEEKIDKNRRIKKFTFPNVKEGSIVEFEYVIKSDFIEYPQPWEFQGAYPRLWSEYSITVPVFFYYVFLSQGYLRFSTEARKDGYSSYNVRVNNDADQSRTIQVNAGSAEYKWGVKDAPGLKEEGFMSSMNNHIQKIVFQLSEQRDPLEYHQYIDSWPQVTNMLMESADFGLEIKRSPVWLGSLTSGLFDKNAGALEKAKRIYAYVRDNFTCTDYNGIWMDKGLKDLIKNRAGNIAEINLLLASLLNYEGIKADPVILSTRPNGLTYEAYPMLFRFNYVICSARIGEKDVYLDASDPGLGFGFLPLRCYNGHARIIDQAATPLYFNADSVVERKQTAVTLSGYEKGSFKGSLKKTSGYYESMSIRKMIREKGKDKFAKEMQVSFPENIVTGNWEIDSLEKNESPVTISAELSMPVESGDFLYLNPWVVDGHKDNPFKSKSRLYPVEMPHAIEEVYSLTMNVPAGYMISELPKEAVIKYNSKGDGLFEYKISQSGEKINLSGHISLKRANYSADEYIRLRDFYNQIIKKQAEQLVFKKKK